MPATLGDLDTNWPRGWEPSMTMSSRKWPSDSLYTGPYLEAAPEVIVDPVASSTLELFVAIFTL